MNELNTKTIEYDREEQIVTVTFNKGISSILVDYKFYTNEVRNSDYDVNYTSNGITIRRWDSNDCRYYLFKEVTLIEGGLE